jgi:hypothetical protein
MVQMPETRPAAHQAHLHPDRAVPKFGTLRSQNFYPEIVFCVPHQNCHWGIPQFHGLKQIHFETKLLSRTCNAINAQEGQLQSSRTLNHETCNFCCQKKNKTPRRLGLRVQFIHLAGPLGPIGISWDGAPVSKPWVWRTSLKVQQPGKVHTKQSGKN